MNSRLISTIFVIIIFLITGLYLTFDILTQKTSSIGALYTYASILCFLLALVKPKAMFYTAIVLTCYMDFFKRFMVIGGMPTETELAFFQAIPMLIVLASAASQFLPIFLGRSIPRDSIKCLMVSVVLCLLLFLSGGSTGGELRQAGQAANMGIYTLLIFVVPLLFPTVEDRIKYVRFSFYCFLPVALYMFKHYYFGLADFEYNYLMTGLSQEIRIFTDDGDARRYFSTMNSAATVSNMLCVVALFGFVKFDDSFALKHPSLRFWNVIISLIFFAAAYMTLARTGWVCGVVTLLAYWFFGSRFRVVLGYALAISCFVVLLASAEYILKHRLLDDWQNFLISYFKLSANNVSGERALVLGTMYDRISGWRYLATQPYGFPLLGTAFGGEVTVQMVDSYRLFHDLLAQYICKLGWIPMFFLTISGVMLLYKFHSFQFRISKYSMEFKLVRYSLASFSGILAGGLANGAQLFNFPQNYYFWLWLSINLATYFDYVRSKKMDVLPNYTKHPMVQSSTI